MQNYVECEIWTALTVEVFEKNQGMAVVVVKVDFDVGSMPEFR
jgi:hypothetical protein